MAEQAGHAPLMGEEEIFSVLCSFLQTQPVVAQDSALYHLRSSDDLCTQASVQLAAMSSAARMTLGLSMAQFLGADTKEQLLLAADLHNTASVISWLHQLAAYWNNSSRTLCFLTSGSTGAPVAYRHTLEDLQQEAALLAASFPTTRRILSVMPTHHIYGYTFSLLLPQQLGIPCLALPPIPTGHFFATLKPHDAVIAFPLFWNTLVESVHHCDTAATIFPVPLCAVTATAPCPETTLVCLREHHNITTLEVYGATETSVIGIRTGEAPLYRFMPHWTPVQGKGDCVHLQHKGRRDQISAPDTLDIREDGYSFIPLARRDKAVQVGGMNVYPAQVEALLLTHPDIRECSVRLMWPKEGARLKAFLVPHDMQPERLERLSGKNFRAWLATRLEAAARPRHVTLGSAIPRTQSGKQCDWDITCFSVEQADSLK